MSGVLRRHRIARSCLVVLLVATFLVLTEASVTAAATATSAGLTWEPPSGYQDFEPVQIPSSGGTLRLDDQTDYLLRAPDRITGPVTIDGGRHVVWIGGHVDIDACCDGSATNRRAVMIMDGDNPVRDRIVHLEGLRLEGDHLAEGIDTNADLAIIQIQNVRVDNLRLASGGHPDVIQTWGSYGELRVDRLTGRTDYQGLFLRVDLANHPRAGDIYLRRVNLEAFASAESIGHTLYSLWNDSTGVVRVDEVYSDAHPDGHYGPGADRATILVENDWRVYPEVNSGVMSWPDHPAKVRTWDDLDAGSIRAGAPPDGDFVPASTVGVHYESPGYGNSAPGPDDGGEESPGWARLIRAAYATRGDPAATAIAGIPELTARQRIVAGRVNATRSAHGKRLLARNDKLMRKAQHWADYLARRDVLAHTTLAAGVPSNWRALGENVGCGGTGADVHHAFVGSAGNRRNLLGRWTHFGTGYATGHGRAYVVQVFMRD